MRMGKYYISVRSRNFPPHFKLRVLFCFIYSILESHESVPTLSWECCFVSFIQYWRVTRVGKSQDFLTSEPRGTQPRLRIAGIPPCPVPPQRSWAWSDLTLAHRLDYVASHTDPLLFLLERTHNLWLPRWLPVAFALVAPLRVFVRAFFLSFLDRVANTQLNHWKSGRWAPDQPCRTQELSRSRPSFEAVISVVRRECRSLHAPLPDKIWTSEQMSESGIRLTMSDTGADFSLTVFVLYMSKKIVCLFVSLL